MRGMGAQGNELKDLVKDLRPMAVFLQETKCKFENLAKLKGYTPVPISTEPYGIAIYIRSDIPFSSIPLVTPLRAAAVKVTINKTPISICSIHLTDDSDYKLREIDLPELKAQLPGPFLLLGDFNGHNPLWGCAKRNTRGGMIEEFIMNENLCLFNDQSITHISDNIKAAPSSLDLSICSPDIFLDFTWSVLPDLHGSDHFPLVLYINDDDDDNFIPRYALKRADWARYTSEWLAVDEDAILESEDPVTVFTEKLLEIADIAIPKSKGKPKPHSNSFLNCEEVKEAKKERQKATKEFLKHPTTSNFLKLKGKTAISRRCVQTNKRQSWRSFVSGLGPRVQAKKVWNVVRALSGKAAPSPVYHLEHNGKKAETNEEIAESFAETYEFQSSIEPHSLQFKSMKQRIEKEYEKSQKRNQNQSSSSHNKQIYNRKFSMKDLRKAIRQSKNSSPGPDQVHYELLKHLPTNALIILLTAFNKVWHGGKFPDLWRKATIIPIPKPEKDHRLPSSYRPISLTSCLCKTMERMVNNRLVWYLERNDLLSKFQCGFRKNRNTTDHLIRLETYIREAFKAGEQCAAVFFDLEKAYDTTWKFGILRDLRNAKLGGYMVDFIENFLSNRSFQVRIGSTFSDFHKQEMGVPQGSILSVTLFVLKINQLASIISEDVLRSLFVDDFKICFRTKSMITLERHIQENLDRISVWAEMNGFKFSVDKTVCMHFWKYKGTRHPNLVMRQPHYKADDIGINTKPIKVVDKHKFLGLIWDRKLTFEHHINYLKAKCNKSLQLLRVLANKNWGADSELLLRIFRALIRSKLDYGAVVYQSATQKSLDSLYPIQNEALRVCLGAFKSSPIRNLHREAGEMPMKFRHLQLSFQYIVRLKANKNNPAYDIAIPKPSRDLDIESDEEEYEFSSDEESEDEDFEEKKGRKDLPPTFTERLEPFVEDAGLPLDSIANCRPSLIEPWTLPEVEIDFSLSSFSKATTSNHIFIHEHRAILDRYRGFQEIYTDGSKIEEKVGAAATWKFGDRKTLKTRLPDNSTIFSAETVALISAVKMANVSHLRTFVVFTDSLSCLQSIQNEDLSYPLITNFLQYYTKCVEKRKRVVLCWVPGHVGIEGNEIADRLAKEALEEDITPIPLHFSEIIPMVKKYFHDIWQDVWSGTPEHLSTFAPDVKQKFFSSNIGRKSQVVLSRVRIGHTNLTHAYRMKGEDREPLCEHCGVVLNVVHFMVHCPLYQDQRNRYLFGSSIEEIFSNDDESIVEYLKECELYDKI